MLLERFAMAYIALASREPEEVLVRNTHRRARLLELIAEVVGGRPTVKYLPVRALDIPASVLDIRQAKANLGWSLHTELAEDVARAWSWVRTLPKSEAEAYSVKTQTSGGGGIP